MMNKHTKKISIQTLDGVYEAELSDGATCDEMFEAFSGLMISATYHPDNVNDCLDDELKWKKDDTEYREETKKPPIRLPDGMVTNIEGLYRIQSYGK